MKSVLFLLTLIPLISNAQLKSSLTCNLYVDVLAGTVNGMEPDFLPAQIKKTIPCFTAEEAEGTQSPCGGVVRYQDNDLSFYTGRDYIDIGPGFKGRLSLPLFGAARSTLFSSLGNPKVKDVNWDAYQTQYGTLILYFDASGRVTRIQFSSKSTETLVLCDGVQ